MGCAPRTIGLGALWLCGCHLVFPYGAADSARRSDLPAGERHGDVGRDVGSDTPATDLRGHDGGREGSAAELRVTKTAVLKVEADEYVEDKPVPHYPEQLWIGNSGGINRWTYLRYSALPPTAKISKAELRLCVQGVGSLNVMKVDIALVVDLWDETGLTWSMPPTANASLAVHGQPISSGSEKQQNDQYVAKVDVTSLVSTALGLAHGFQLKPATPNLDLTLYAREYIINHGSLPATPTDACVQAKLYNSELVVTYTE